MEYNEVVNTRRSIRKYIDKEVKDILVKEIIESAMKSPSAHNLQPWKVMVTKGELKNQIANLLFEKSKTSEDPSLVRTSNTIKEANVLLLIFYEPLSKNRDFDILSIGSFIEHILLKATDLGLGSLWIANTNFVSDEISKLVNIDLECISTVALGYKENSPSARPRKEYSEIVITQSFK